MKRLSSASAVAACVLTSLIAVAIGWPLLGVALAAIASARTDDHPLPSVDWPVLARSGAIALLIGALATAIALPPAWAARRMAPRWFLVLLTPMLLPSYLAYIGWSELRAPRTMLGDWLMRGTEAGANEWPIIAGRVFAAGGLVLWSWPLAALILAARVRRIDRSTLDALRLEPVPAWRGWLTRLSMIRGSIAAATAAVALVMLGSAVPLHLAQFQTFAIRLWMLLDLTPPDDQWRVWLAAWPLAVIALACGTWIGCHATADEGAASVDEGSREPLPRAGLAAAALLWLASVAAPLVLMARSVGSFGAVRAFLRTHGDALGGSGAIAAVVALLAFAVACTTWVGLGAWRCGRGARTLTRCSIVLLLAAGLVPGVLVGSATSIAWSRAGLASDAGALASIVLAHVARLGFVAALLGAWARRCEPAVERELRLLDGGDTWRGWARAAFPLQAGPVLAGAIAVGLMSFHEIEAAVMLQPPGWGSFPLRMLQLLHFNRMDDLAAAVVVVMILGMAAAGAVIVLAGIRPSVRLCADAAR